MGGVLKDAIRNCQGFSPFRERILQNPWLPCCPRSWEMLRQERREFPGHPDPAYELILFNVQSVWSNFSFHFYFKTWLKIFSGCLVLLSCRIVERLAFVHLAVHHPHVHLLHADVLLKVLQRLWQLLVAQADGHGPVAVCVGALVVHLHLPSRLLLLLNIPGIMLVLLM